jgi:hypothetical protein
LNLVEITIIFMKNAVYCDVAPCRSCVTRRYSKTSGHFTGSTRRHIPEDGILHSHRRENFKSYNYIRGFPQFLHAYLGISSQSRSRLFLSTFIVIRHFLFIIPFYDIII